MTRRFWAKREDRGQAILAWSVGPLRADRARDLEYASNPDAADLDQRGRRAFVSHRNGANDS